MKTKRKITTLVLSVIMGLTLCTGFAFTFAATAFAADGDTCAVEDCGGTYTNGICTKVEGETHYQPATETTDKYDVNGDDTFDTVYEIANAGQLYWFADKVNNDNANYGKANVVLTDDITANEALMEKITVADDGTVTVNEGANVRVWTPIGNSSNQFTGNFNGKGFTVSGLYFNDGDTEYVGLFGALETKGTVRNVGVVDSYFNGFCYVGSVVGTNYGTVASCYSIGDVSGNKYVGGVVGVNINGTISNCYNIGDVSGDRYVGGVVGSVSLGTVTNCYNVGAVSGNLSFGDVAGDNRGTVTNCYYLTDTAVTDHAEAKTVDEFASGEVAYLLQGEQTDHIWGQTVGKEDSPVLGGLKVYNVENCNKGSYSNTATVGDHFGGTATCMNGAFCNVCGKSYGETVEHSYTNGICVYKCGNYEQPATDSNGVYQIANVGQLTWFAEFVNSDNKSANAILLADIDLAGSEWTTICPTDLYYETIVYPDAGYAGTFDGNNHVVKNLALKGVSGEKTSIGLIGTLSGTVKNLGVEMVTFDLNKAADIRAAAIVGQIIGGTVSNCYVKGATITPNSFVAGGIAACNYAGTIENCYVVGSEIFGTSGRFGYIVGDNRGDISENDRKGTVNNCYTDASFYVGGRTGTETNCAANVSVEYFVSGEIAYKLNGSTSEGDLVWGQSIDEETYPVLGGKTVYWGYFSVDCDTNKVYTNDASVVEEKNPHNFENGVCTVCDGYQSATLIDESNRAEFEFTDATYDGYYAIANVGQLHWYSTNKGGKNAVLVSDIEIGTASAPWVDWDPVATGAIFDGNGHTVSMFLTYSSVNGTADSRGVSLLNANTVRNLILTGSITCNSNYRVAALSYSGYGSVFENIISYVDITNQGTAPTGGIVALFGNDGAGSTMTNCAVYADISGGNCVGGLVGQGWSGWQYWTLTNCAFYGNVTSKTERAGALVGYSSTSSGASNVRINNCYYPNTLNAAGGFASAIGNNDSHAMTKEQFASGEVAYLLGSAWGQDLTTDGTYPTLGGTPISERYDFFGQQLNLGVDLSMKYYVVAYCADFKAELLKVEFILVGVRSEVSGEYDPATGFYVFTLDGINPQCMGDNISATLYYNGEVKAAEAVYSVQQSLIDTYEKAGDDEALKQLIIDTLEYGAAAQVKQGYKTDALVNDVDFIENGSADREIPDASVVLNATFLGYTVVFGQQNFIKIRVNLEDSNKLYVNDVDVTAQIKHEKIGDNTYQVYKTAGIAATDFATAYKFEVRESDGETVVETLTLSVNDYLYVISQSSSDKDMAALANALYNYGVSGKNYANCKAGNHVWNNGVCKHCNVGHDHADTDWDNGICTVCELVCDHDWNYGICTVCEAPHAHADTDWVNGVCTVCKACLYEEKTIEYRWSDDYSSCTAIATCKNCNKILDSEEVTPELDTEPDANGNYYWRAKFENSEFGESSALSYSVTDNNTYEVYDAAGLLAWNAAAQTDGSINLSLMEDIDMYNAGEWKPVGDGINPYAGTINGNNHTISNITLSDLTDDTNKCVYVSFVGYMSNYDEGGGMKDIIFDSPTISMPESYSKTKVYVGIVGYLSDCTMTNVSVTGNAFWIVNNAPNYGYVYIGVLAGCVDYEGVVKGCHVGDGIILNVTISNTSVVQVGGIVGENNGSVLGCTVGTTIKVLSFSIYSTYVGGIVGSHEYPTMAKINSCVYYGELTATITEKGFSCIGGIVGHDGNFSNGIVGCYVTGTVTAGEGNAASIGAIVGYVDGRSTYANLVKSCYWSGNDGLNTFGDYTGSTTCSKVNGITVTWETVMTAMNNALSDANAGVQYVTEGHTDKVPLVPKMQ